MDVFHEKADVRNIQMQSDPASWKDILLLRYVDLAVEERFLIWICGETVRI